MDSGIDCIQEIDGDSENVLEAVKVAAGAFREEWAKGRREVAEKKTNALATSAQLAVNAASIATTAARTETRRLGVDHALRPGMARWAARVKRQMAYEEKWRRLQGWERSGANGKKLLIAGILPAAQ